MYYFPCWVADFAGATRQEQNDRRYLTCLEVCETFVFNLQTRLFSVQSVPTCCWPTTHQWKWKMLRVGAPSQRPSATETDKWVSDKATSATQRGIRNRLGWPRPSFVAPPTPCCFLFSRWALLSYKADYVQISHSLFSRLFLYFLIMLLLNLKKKYRSLPCKWTQRYPGSLRYIPVQRNKSAKL